MLFILFILSIQDIEQRQIFKKSDFWGEKPPKKQNQNRTEQKQNKYEKPKTKAKIK